jgi:hypothetical protein
LGDDFTTIHDESDLVKDLRRLPRQIHARKDGNSAVLRETTIMNAKKMVLTTVTTLLLVGYAATGLADDDNGLAYGRSQAPAPLEGTWVVTIQPIVCSSGQDVPGVPSVTAYLTFAPGGTMTETNSNVAFEPGQRGPGHGYWERSGRTSYQFVFQAFIQFDSQLPPFRYKRGYQRLDQTLELQANDEFTTVGTVRFFPGTSNIPTTPSGCARSTGVRML